MAEELRRAIDALPAAVKALAYKLIKLRELRAIIEGGIGIMAFGIELQQRIPPRACEVGCAPGSWGNGRAGGVSASL